MEVGVSVMVFVKFRQWAQQRGQPDRVPSGLI